MKKFTQHFTSNDLTQQFSEEQNVFYILSGYAFNVKGKSDIKDQDTLQRPMTGSKKTKNKFNKDKGDKNE